MARRHADFVRLFNAGDADRVADTFYAADALVLPPNHPPVAGREAIRAFLRDFLASAARTCTTALTRIEVGGELAYVVGTYTAAARLPDGTTVIDTGNLLEAWRRDADGAWWCVADMYGSDRPPA